METWQELWRLFEKGGFVMPVLLLGSIMAVAVAVERYRAFRIAAAKMTELRERLETQLSAGAWAEALVVAEQYGNLSALVAVAGLARQDQGPRAVEAAMEGAANRGAARLRQRLELLRLMVSMAPLWGLLGTVIGMIRSFNVLNVSSGQPFAITGGVGEALVATAAGLFVAILALILLAYFRAKLDGILNDVEETAAMISGALLEKQR